jgi:hypothetical protein
MLARFFCVIVFVRKANLLIFVQVVIHGSMLNLQPSSTCYLAVQHSTSSPAYGFLIDSTTVPSTISLLYGLIFSLTIHTT